MSQCPKNLKKVQLKEKELYFEKRKSKSTIFKKPVGFSLRRPGNRSLFSIFRPICIVFSSEYVGVRFENIQVYRGNGAFV